VLGRRDGEQRVRDRVSARGATRRLGEAGRVRVDADHQRAWLRPGGGEYGTAVTRTEIDRDPRVSRGEL
jgi:hypothetical protein